jgi:hypothetical protein
VVREDRTRERLKSALVAALAAALGLAGAFLGGELGGRGGALVGFGLFELVLGLVHGLAGTAFDHSDENVLQRLREEAEITEPQLAEVVAERR